MRTVRRFLRVGFQALSIVALLAVAIPLISLMLPVKIWRTGELPTEPPQLYPAKPFAVPPLRVWIDTDAACGLAQRTDPDDCFAILLLAQQNTVEVVGISTVFGNAPLDDTDRITRDLIHLLGKSKPPTIPVYRGASTPLDSQHPAHAVTSHDAVVGLRSALEQGPLTILALGSIDEYRRCIGRPSTSASQRDSARGGDGSPQGPSFSSGRRRHRALISRPWSRVPRFQFYPRRRGRHAGG